MILGRLMKALSETEHRTLREQLHLPPRSERILDRFRAPADRTPTTKQLCSEFGLTKENLYRICSQIADECIRILAPATEFPKLDFYHRKFLAPEFDAEVVRTEKKLLEIADRDQLERFYGFVFDRSLTRGVNDINIDLTASYGTKWHRMKRNPPPDDELAITMRLRYVQICALPARKKLTVDKMRTISRSLLTDVAERAANSPNLLARHYYYQSEWKACNYDNITGEGRTIWLAKSCDLIAKNESSFPPGSLEFNLLQLAYEEALYRGKIQGAFEQFLMAYRGQVPDSARNALYLIRFARIALLARHFDTARHILGVLEAHPFTTMTDGIYHPYLLLNTALHIIENDLDKADNGIQFGFSYNTAPRYFLSYEIEWRALEVICALKRGDLAHIERLVTRDMKWLHSRRYSLSQSPWPYFYKAVRAYVVYRQTGKHAGLRLQEQFSKFRESVREYALLLEPQISELFPSKKD